MNTTPQQPSRQSRFRGAILGALLGDVLGAVVEGMPPAGIRNTYGGIDGIVEVCGKRRRSGWFPGRYTDDSAMMRCVAEWLIHDPSGRPQPLFQRFADTFADEPWRRYGAGAAGVLDLYREKPDLWQELATVFFPTGSFGNGAAMRVAPVGLVHAGDMHVLIDVAIASARPTHVHPQAQQGAALQAAAVGRAVQSESWDAMSVLRILRAVLFTLQRRNQDTDLFSQRLEILEEGVERNALPIQIAEEVGVGVRSVEAVPMGVVLRLDPSRLVDGCDRNSHQCRRRHRHHRRYDWRHRRRPYR